MAQRRILLVNKYAHVTGGADRHCLTLVDELRRRGHEVALLSSVSPLNIEHAGAFVPLTVTHETRRQLRGRARLSVAASALWNEHAAAAMRGLIRTFRPDVVHIHKLYPQLSLAPVVVAARSRLPLVQTLHDYEFVSADPFEHRGHALDRTSKGLDARALNTATFALRRVAHRRCVRRWIAVSAFVSSVHRSRGIETTVLSNPTPAAAPPAPRATRHGVVFVGRLTPEKGVGDVIEAARLTPSLQITVYGIGPLEGDVRAAAELLPNLSFGGRLEPNEVVSKFSRALVALVPSRWEEPGPLTALEARAAGTPVVAYRAGGLPDYVGEAGRIVSRHPRLLAQAAHALHDDEEAWQQCAAAAAGAAAAWGIADYVDALEQVYEEARRA